MACGAECIPERVKWAIAFIMIALSTPAAWRLYQLAHGGGCYYNEEHVLKCSAPIPLKFVDFGGDGKENGDAKDNGPKQNEKGDPPIGDTMRDAWKQAQVLLAQDNKAARVQYVYTIDKWFIITGLLAATVICSSIYIIGEMADRTCGNVNNCLWFVLTCRCCWPKPKQVRQYRTSVAGSSYTEEYSDEDMQEHAEHSLEPVHARQAGARKAGSRRRSRRR